MSIITYLVELCRGFLESGNGMEIYSIHGHAVRLMINPETPLSPVNWVSRWGVTRVLLGCYLGVTWSGGVTRVLQGAGGVERVS